MKDRRKVKATKEKHVHWSEEEERRMLSYHVDLVIHPRETDSLSGALA